MGTGQDWAWPGVVQKHIQTTVAHRLAEWMNQVTTREQVSDPPHFRAPSTLCYSSNSQLATDYTWHNFYVCVKKLVLMILLKCNSSRHHESLRNWSLTWYILILEIKHAKYSDMTKLFLRNERGSIFDPEMDLIEPKILGYSILIV